MTRQNDELCDLYLLGARQKRLLLKREEEWNLYESALILHLNPETGAVRTCVEYKTPPDARANDASSVVFKAGSIKGDTLYTCTSTEVLIFKLPAFEQIGYLSLPCFNDLHHVTPTPQGNLLVASTGLDMVFEFNRQGKVIAEWAVLDEEPWTRFSRDIDYRKVDSTKPHQSHPNFVFQLNGETWVTRFRQRDAICLNDRSKRIEIAVQSPHDGLIRGDRIFFTTVDGHIVIADVSTLAVERIIDLKTIDGANSLLGWCRGVLPVSENLFWVGFTRVRKTNLQENILWVRNIFHEGTASKPTHIALYDTSRMQRVKEFDLEAYGMNIVFSIFPAVHSAVSSALERTVSEPQCALMPEPSRTRL